jgi:hypothetical protein
MNVTDLEELVKTDMDSETNRAGYTRLFALAEDIAKKRGNISGSQIEQLVLDLDLADFDYKELTVLNSFISHSEIDTDEIFERYLGFIKSEELNNKSDSIFIRGIIYRFIIEKDSSKYYELFDEVKNDADLKEKYPWIWIDCIFHYDWSLAETEISERIKSENREKEIENLMHRLPYFYQRYNSELLNALHKWYQEDLFQLDEFDSWIKLFDIPFKLPSMRAKEYASLKFKPQLSDIQMTEEGLIFLHNINLSYSFVN